MTQTKLAIFLNEVFKYIVLFLIFFVWINYYYPNFINSVIIAVVLASITSFLLTKLMYKKFDKEYNSKKEKNQIKECGYSFLFSSFDDNLNFFNDIFKQKNIPTKISNMSLILYPNTNHEILFLPYFTPNGVNEEVIINTYKLCKELNINKVIICTTQINQSAKNLCNSIKDYKFVLYDDKDVYNTFLKPNNMYPKKTVEFKSNAKLNLQSFYDMLTNKKNTKSYFVGGLMLLFASLFVNLGVYYILFSTVLFMLSLISFYNPKFTNAKRSRVFN